MLLLPGERLDDLMINQLKIIQHADEFRFSLDAVLLAHFATVKPGACAVDLGAGAGAVSFLLAARGAGFVTGVEINERVAAMAQRSVEFNRLTNKVAIKPGDLRQVADHFSPGLCDLVVANPPYRPAATGKISPNDRLAIARHEIKATLSDVVAAAKYLTKVRGRFALVHLPERLPEILQAMAAAGLEPKRLQLVYPKPERRAVMLLVEGIKGAKPGLDVLPPLIIYHDDGTYTESVMAYYKQVNE